MSTTRRRHVRAPAFEVASAPYRGSFRHRRLPVPRRRVLLVVFSFDALLLLYFFAGITDVNWTTPLSPALAFAGLTAALVTLITFAFFRFTGGRLQRYQDQTGALPLRALDRATTMSIGLAFSATLVWAALIFIRLYTEVLWVLGREGGVTAIAIGLAIALVSIPANIMVIAVYALTPAPARNHDPAQTIAARGHYEARPANHAGRRAGVSTTTPRHILTPACEVGYAPHRGSLRHRLPVPLRLVLLIVFSFDALLLAYFFAGITNVDWASPLSPALAFALVLTAYVTMLSYEFLTFAGERVRACKEHPRASVSGRLDGFTRVACGFAAVGMACIAIVMFTGTRAEVIFTLGPNAGVRAIIVGVTVALAGFAPILPVIVGPVLAFGRNDNPAQAIDARGRRRTGHVAPSAAGLLVAAARILPAAHRARYAEEYRSELWELAQSGVGRQRQLQYALRQLCSAFPVAFTLHSPRRKSPAP